MESVDINDKFAVRGAEGGADRATETNDCHALSRISDVRNTFTEITLQHGVVKVILKAIASDSDITTASDDTVTQMNLYVVSAYKPLNAIEVVLTALPTAYCRLPTIISFTDVTAVSFNTLLQYSRPVQFVCTFKIVAKAVMLAAYCCTISGAAAVGSKVNRTVRI